MTLHVPFDQFAKTVLRVFETKEAYITVRHHGCVVTSAQADKGFMVVAKSDLNSAAAKKRLQHAGLQVFEGHWATTEDVESPVEDCLDPFIAAVAYKSGESMPGVWVDAYSAHPTQVQVLRALFDEFQETGESPDVSFEEFVRLSEPNVVIVTPNDIQSFLEKKEESTKSTNS